MWECYDGQAKFLDELKKRQVIARKRGYGPDYINLFVKHNKKRYVSSLDNAVFVTRSMLGLTNRDWRDG